MQRFAAAGYRRRRQCCGAQCQTICPDRFAPGR